MWTFKSILIACAAVSLSCFVFLACAESEEKPTPVEPEVSTVDSMSTCECFELFSNGDSLPEGCLLGHITFPNFNETDNFSDEIIASIDLIHECQGPDSAQYFLSVMLEHCRDMPYLSKPESDQSSDSTQTAEVELSCEEHIQNCDAYYTSYMQHLDAFRNDPSSHDDVRQLIVLAGGYFERFQIEKVRDCLSSDFELLERYTAMEDTILFGLGMEADPAFAH